MNMKVIAIPLDMIEMPPRHREIDEDYATMLAESIKADRQRTPIEVRSPKDGTKYRLIAGAHRFRAHQLNKAKSIMACVRDVTDDEAEMLEIDENLIRHDLTALDRATALARRKALYLKMFPETAQGGDRRSDQNRKFAVLIDSFSKATAKRLGISDDTIERSIRRFNKITPEVRKLLSGTRYANKGAELDALTSIEDEDTQRLVTEMVVQGKAKTVKEALAVVTNTEAPPVDKAHEDFEAFRRRWKKYTPKTKQSIVALVMAEFGLEYVEKGAIGPKAGA